VDTSHPRYVLDHNRCVLCSRCVRACAEIEGARHVPAEMPAGQRVLGYAEVSLGLTPMAAVAETSRCLRCDIRSAER
jgi:predicted molibdopterin-dependent oxidoreductase YjgC